MTSHSEKIFKDEAVKMIKISLQERGIFLLGDDRKFEELALKIGALYHTMEKEDEI